MGNGSPPAIEGWLRHAVGADSSNDVRSSAPEHLPAETPACSDLSSIAALFVLTVSGVVFVVFPAGLLRRGQLYGGPGQLHHRRAADSHGHDHGRLDPFERTGWPENGTKDGSQEYFGWFQYEFWRFVFVQQEVAKLAMTAIEFPPMQKGASFNLDAVKAKIEAARAAMAK